MSTYSTVPPPRYRGRHRRPLTQETSALIAAAGIWVVGGIAGIVMTGVGR
jgi:hypothetical protein